MMPGGKIGLTEEEFGMVELKNSWKGTGLSNKLEERKRWERKWYYRLLGFSDDEPQERNVNNFKRSKVMAVYNYQAPCSPDYKEPTSIEECLPVARGLVQKIAEGERRPEVGVAPRL